MVVASRVRASETGITAAFAFKQIVNANTSASNSLIILLSLVLIIISIIRIRQTMLSDDIEFDLPTAGRDREGSIALRHKVDACTGKKERRHCRTSTGRIANPIFS